MIIKDGILILLIVLEIFFGIKEIRVSMKRRYDEALTYAGVLFVLNIVTFAVIRIFNITGT